MARRQFGDYIRSLNPDLDDNKAVGLDGISNVGSAGFEQDVRSAEAGRKLAVVPNEGVPQTPQATDFLTAVDTSSGDLAFNFGSEQLARSTQVNERRGWWTLASLLVVFVIPVCMIGAYYLFFASDVYATNFRFSVQNISSSQSAAAVSSAMSLVGIPSNNDSVNYQVADFLTSRTAVDQLQSKIGLVDLYSKSSIDSLSRFKKSNSLEAFESYWKSMVSAKYDQVTGIVSVSVEAFKPQDSYLIATTLVKAAEDLVNNLEQRTLDDAVQSAALELTKAQQHLEESHLRLTQFRKASGVIDPTASFVASNSTLVQTLQSSLATLQTRNNLLVNQKMDPKGVAMTSLNEQIEATKEQLRASGASVATARDFTPPGGQNLDNEALSTVIAQYEKLNLDYQFAQTLVTSAMTALEQAKVNAFTQHLYITPYVQPALPTSPKSRTFTITLATAICFVVWFLIYTILNEIRNRFGHAGV